jgi:hypothetical protein
VNSPYRPVSDSASASCWILLVPSGSSGTLIAQSTFESSNAIVRSSAPTVIPQVHVFSLQDVLNIFDASGRAVCVSEATTMLPSHAILKAATVGSDDDIEKQIGDILDLASAKPSSGATALNVLEAVSLPSDLQSYQHLLALESFVNVCAIAKMVRENPGHVWNMDDPVSFTDFTKKRTNALFDVISLSMSGFLVQESSSTATFQKHLSFADLHTEFLKGIFSSFDFPKDTLTELDGILTTTTQDLVKMTDSGSSSGTVDHMIFVTYFEPVPGLNFNAPKIRLFYLHINHDSWMSVCSHGKNQSDTTTAMIDFNMYYTDATFTMTWMPSDDVFAKFQAMLGKLCGKQLTQLEGYLHTTNVSK